MIPEAQWLKIWVFSMEVPADKFFDIFISVVPVSASYYSSSSSYGTIIFRITVLVPILEP